MAAVLGWAAVSTGLVLDGSQRANEIREAVAAKDAEAAALRGRMAMMQRDTALLRGAVSATVARLEQRQTALSLLVGGERGRVVLASSTESDNDGLPLEAQRVLAPLHRLESQQLALVDQASVATQARYQTARALIRGLGLDPGRFSRMSAPAVGGTFERVGPEDGVNDLYQAWNSMAELGRAAASIPARTPVQAFSFTSNYGVRYDPFTGGAAMHAGVDMAGATGEPIYSSAEGVVVKAGWVNGYGNMVEVDHGRGITTRYGHMSRLQVRPGDRVVAGDQIGKMGSTGRSTGTHLHYEVRIDGQAVDPMPFLRAAPQISQVQAAASTAVGGPSGPAAASSMAFAGGN